MKGRPPTELVVPILAYCATCKREFGEAERSSLGLRLLCPEDDQDNPTHIAAVVKGRPGELWLSIEACVLRYEARYTAMRWFSHWGGWFRLRHGLFLLVQTAALVLALTLVRAPAFFGFQGPLGSFLQLVATVVAIYAILDALLERTSVAFISRFPTHPVRTVLISVLSFLNVGLAFSVFYALAGAQFTPELNSIRALYFSFVTITTLGYGDIHPRSEAWAAQMLVVTELAVGLYLVAVILAVFVSWANANPMLPEYRTVADVIKRGGLEPGASDKGGTG